MLNLQGKWIDFVPAPPDPRKKTLVWRVVAHGSGVVLGDVRWMAAWRRYAFYTRGDIILDSNCLDDLRTFLDASMVEWRAEKAKAE